MKRTIIASIVGGILIFLWQFLSWTVIDMHRSAHEYTPNQDAIIQTLSTNLTKDGGYMVPGLPANATTEDHERMMKEHNGKPWASIQYHKSSETTMSSMMMNMVRGLLVNIIIVALFCSMLNRFKLTTFGSVFSASIFLGLIVFLNAPYTMHIWYDTFDVMAHFADQMISWALCGLWLGWYFSRRSRVV